MIGLLLSACVFEPVDETEPETEPATVQMLWQEQVADGATVQVTGLVVSSPRITLGNYFYAQDPIGGSESGLRVELAGERFGWPPPIGTPIELVGTFDLQRGAPVVILSTDDSEVLDGTQPIRIVDWADEAQLAGSLVRLTDLTITSSRDPLGQADTDGPVSLGGEFGIGPGYGRTGNLAGILYRDHISPRAAADWSGTLEPDPYPTTTLDQLDQLPEGTPVVVDDLLLATPWSRDGEWALLQDATGAGVWVDDEGWGLHQQVEPGTVASWSGQVRFDEAGVRLRAWELPVIEEATRSPVVSTELLDGALITLEVADLGPVGVYGDRMSGDVVLDNRFMDLDDLAEGAEVTGPVRGSDRVAPIPTD